MWHRIQVGNGGLSDPFTGSSVGSGEKSETGTNACLCRQRKVKRTFFVFLTGTSTTNHVNNSTQLAVESQLPDTRCATRLTICVPTTCFVKKTPSSAVVRKRSLGKWLGNVFPGFPDPEKTLSPAVPRCSPDVFLFPKLFFSPASELGNSGNVGESIPRLFRTTALE